MSKPSSARPAELHSTYRVSLPALTIGDDGMPLPLLFSEIVRQTPLAISITDEDAVIQYVNPAFETLTGYDMHSALGKSESILSHRQTPRSVYDDLWSTIRRKRKWHGTLVNRRKNGEPYLADLTIIPVLDQDREIAGFLGIHRDVTELFSLEKKVHHQQVLIESVLVAAPMVVALVDADRHVILENQAHKGLLGPLQGRQPAHVFLETLDREGLDLSQGFSGQEVQLDIAGQLEPRWFSVSGALLDEFDSTAGAYFVGEGNKRPRCLLLVANEITVLKRQIERARMQYLRASLAEQQRIHGMRETLLGAIFQLETPFNVVRAAASMLDRGADPSKAREVLDQVLESGTRALETLRGALPESVEEDEVNVNLNSLLQDVLSLMTERFLAYDVTIEWEPENLLRPILGRPNRLRTVLLCLVENALLAVAEAGRNDPRIRIATRNRGDDVDVLVQDNGPGISQELRLKVFEPFYAGWQRARGSAGMGLSLAQEHVNQHGGVIEIDSTTEEGCHVRVSFPTVPNGREVK